MAATAGPLRGAGRYERGEQEDRSHRPHRRRQPTWPAELAAAVLRLRSQFPRWGKDKPVVLLQREGVAVSTSMVGRILTPLQRLDCLRVVC